MGKQFIDTNAQERRSEPIRKRINLEGRPRDLLESKLGEQAETRDNVFVLRNITERKIEEAQELLVTFIKLKSAFDMVERREIWRTFDAIEVINSFLYNDEVLIAKIKKIQN